MLTHFAEVATYGEYRPRTVENGSDDFGLLTTGNFTTEQIAQIGEWIRKNIRPSDQVYYRNSYGLNHSLEEDTGIHMGHNEFKDAMVLAGYYPINPEAVNWSYRISYLPEEMYNPNPFVHFLKMYYEHKDAPDILSRMLHDTTFPVFANYGIIKHYLQEQGAGDQTIKEFERCWGLYQDFLN